MLLRLIRITNIFLLTSLSEVETITKTANQALGYRMGHFSGGAAPHCGQFPATNLTSLETEVESKLRKQTSPWYCRKTQRRCEQHQEHRKQQCNQEVLNLGYLLPQLIVSSYHLILRCWLCFTDGLQNSPKPNSLASQDKPALACSQRQVRGGRSSA